MNQYLLDTNICIYYIKGLHNLKSKFKEVGPDNCYISEITMAELKFGVAKSQAKKNNQKALPPICPHSAPEVIGIDGEAGYLVMRLHRSGEYCPGM
ncbi:PIN domain-containing protein [Natronogracilivirgula saccharolytica]|uniref:PIN domain-containing protein n=1 Tax=Natronogracilivirga saccharolytica TaxID=2812953 RepID=A0A8J7SD30_9BACT|nr:PIN domain-containing protein [Natronogracilivirga saccharolytica]